MKDAKMIKGLLALLLLFAAGLSAPAQEPAADSIAVETPSRAESAPVAQDPDRVWEQANTAYINNDFREAADLYEGLLAQGLSSAKLYYNLGNACFKLDRTGEAILYYRRALRLAPASKDVRYNLSVAEARTRDNIERIPDFFLTEWLRAVRHTMSGGAWTLLSLGALAGALAMALFYLLSARLARRKAGFYGTLCCAVLFVVTTSFAASDRREPLEESEAVVTASSAAVKSSPAKGATDLFVLHEGTVVEIDNRLEGWCEITIADGKKGWIEASKITVV